MNNSLRKLPRSRLSIRAKQSSFSTFAWRTSVSMLAMPVGGYLIGSLINHYWPGETPWAIALIFAGLFLGCMNLWCWMKQSQ